MSKVGLSPSEEIVFVITGVPRNWLGNWRVFFVISNMSGQSLTETSFRNRNYSKVEHSQSRKWHILLLKQHLYADSSKMKDAVIHLGKAFMKVILTVFKMSFKKTILIFTGWKQARHFDKAFLTACLPTWKKNYTHIRKKKRRSENHVWEDA